MAQKLVGRESTGKMNQIKQMIGNENNISNNRIDFTYNSNILSSKNAINQTMQNVPLNCSNAFQIKKTEKSLQLNMKDSSSK